MSFATITSLVGGALTGALPLFFAYLVYRVCTGQGPIHWKHEAFKAAFVFYLLCLFHITTWRYGVDWSGVFTLGGRTLNIVPFVETLGNLRDGIWVFLYNLLGNILWFVPFGLLFPISRPGSKLWSTVLVGAGVSFLIELMQFLLRTGIADIDDLLFNTLGAALGFGLYHLLFPRHQRRAIFH